MNLTKTDFIAYLDAPMHLWAIKHNKLEQKEINAYLEHLFEQGYDVEQYAERYIQEYLIPQYKGSEVLLQPTYIDGNFEARTDVLIKNPKTNLWDMYEIKSSTKVTMKHKYDATFQAMVFSQKLDLGNIYILHLNKEYIRDGDINLKELFVVADISEQTDRLIDKVHNYRYDALEVMREETPETVLRCIKPKTCPCPDICHPNLPEYSIYDVNRISGSEKKVRRLEEQSIFEIYDIPDDFPLSEKQKFQVQVAKRNKASIDVGRIKSDLDSLEYPLYFIDYETFNPAIPKYDGYKPYDQIPFQWSLHLKQDPDSELEHFEFLETEDKDPMPEFISKLRQVVEEGKGTFIVWNATFEGKMNERMGEIHPEFENFTTWINENMYDLMLIFRDNLYADPKFKGSYSIKKVLPILAPELSYDGMEIGEGATAMASWKDMVHSDLSHEEKESIRKNLLKYCELDTFAMVRIWEELNT